VDLTKPAKTLAILGSSFLLALPLLGFLLESILLSTYEMGNLTYQISPTYFWVIFILNYLFGFASLEIALTGPTITRNKGIFFLIFGTLTTAINLGHSAMLAGILLMLAGLLVLLAYADPTRDTYN
jgi:hypothetical protein